MDWEAVKARTEVLIRYDVYRSSNHSDFNLVDATAPGVTHYTDTAVQPGTVYYYRIVAQYAAPGAPSSPPSPVVAAVTPQRGSVSGSTSTTSTSLKQGLTMVSVPFDPGSIDAAELLGLTPATSGFAPIAAYDPGSNQYLVYPYLPGGNGKQLQPGRGYWVLEDQDRSTTAGGALVSSPFSFTLQPGWNLIGDPFPEALDISTLRFTPQGQVSGVDAGTTITLDPAKAAGLVPGPFWEWDAAAGRYTPSTTLQPYHGYWIYIDPTAAGNAAVTVIFTRS